MANGQMKIISFIEDAAVIEKILRHLGLWETRNHDPPTGHISYIHEIVIDYEYSQIPFIDYYLQ